MGKLKKQLVATVDGMPAFPQSVFRILQLTTDINCNPRDIVQVVEHDPVLTMNLLKLVNSPYFGLSRRVASISQAVVFVGINTLKNLALSIAPIEVLPKNNWANPRMHQLLLHSLGSAAIARRLSRQLGVPEIDATDYFVAGLLHDFGKVALARCKTKTYRKSLQQAAKKEIPLHQMEKKLFGQDHCQVGALLGKKWCLPKALVSCMAGHHDETAPSSPMLDCVRAANEIAKRLQYGHSGNPVIAGKLPPTVANRFGQDLPQLIQSLGNVSEELSRARVFIQFQGNRSTTQSG